jgi:kynureninase
MTDKDIINEFTKLYNDYSDIGKALHHIRKIISAQAYERLIDGLEKVRK